MNSQGDRSPRPCRAILQRSLPAIGRQGNVHTYGTFSGSAKHEARRCELCGPTLFDDFRLSIDALIYCITPSTDTYASARGSCLQQATGEFYLLLVNRSTMRDGEAKRREKEREWGEPREEKRRGWVASNPRQSEPNELRGLVAARPDRPFVSPTLYHRLLPLRP